MAETMARDRLGRIIYEGDIVSMEGYEDDVVTSVKIGVKIGSGQVKRWYGDVVARQLLTVDLEESPPRTYYERYFADLGSGDDVADAADEICGKSHCQDCVISFMCRWNMCRDIRISDKAVI